MRYILYKYKTQPFTGSIEDIALDLLTGSIVKDLVEIRGLLCYKRPSSVPTPDGPRYTSAEIYIFTKQLYHPAGAPVKSEHLIRCYFYTLFKEDDTDGKS